KNPRDQVLTKSVDLTLKPQQARNNSLRVLYVLDGLRRGGKERQAVELIRGLRSCRDVESSLVCMDRLNDFEDDTNRIGVPVHFVIRSFRWDPSIFVHLYRIMQSFKPHIVHTFCTMTTAYC